MALSIVPLIKELHPEIKWPNDILISGKKVSGILVEIDKDEIFLGVGINVNSEKEDLISVDQPVTSLKIESRRKWDKLILLKQIETYFLKNLETLEKEGFSPFKKNLEELLAWKKNPVICYTGKKEWQGCIEGLSPEGNLILKLEDGSIKKLSSGTLRKKK